MGEFSFAFSSPALTQPRESGYGSINDGPEDWEIASQGSLHQYNNIFETEREINVAADPEEEFAEEKAKHEAHKLGQFRATSIAGNDITCKYCMSKPRPQ